MGSDGDTTNPYEPPKANLDPQETSDVEPVFYARLGIRFRAFLIDYFLLLGGFALVAFLGTQLQGISGAGAALFVLWVLVAVLYEPLMVWRTGGTIGHHVKNICVVSDRTGANPTLPIALIRSLIKMFLGGLSFVWMLMSARQQAIHDALVNVTVRIKDKKLARRRDYVRA